MDEKTIAPGYEVPVLDEEKNDNYAVVEAAVNEHNQTAQPGEKYWGISLENEKYTVYEYGKVPTPPTEEEQMETLRAKKLEEASDACEAAITAGMLLLNQLEYCNKNRDLILQRAETTYRKALSRKIPLYQKVCCNFEKLERKSKKYDPNYVPSKKKIHATVPSK